MKDGLVSVVIGILYALFGAFIFLTVILGLCWLEAIVERHAGVLPGIFVFLASVFSLIAIPCVYMDRRK